MAAQDNLIIQEEEVSALEAIYGNFFRYSASSKAFKIILLDDATNLEVVLEFQHPAAYPAVPPLMSLTGCFEGKVKNDLIQDCLGKFQPGEIVLFDIVEFVREKFNDYVSLYLEQQEKEKERERELEALAVDLEAHTHLTPTSSPPEQAAARPRIRINTGEAITDRKSKFVGHYAEVFSEEDVAQVRAQLLEDKKIAQAVHGVMLAYRIETAAGLINEGRDHDGEGGAGDVILNLLQQWDVRNAVVVVSRWFGGILLGPDRFRHIRERAKVALETAGVSPAHEKEKDESQKKQKGHKGKRR